MKLCFLAPFYSFRRNKGNKLFCPGGEEKAGCKFLRPFGICSGKHPESLPYREGKGKERKIGL